MSYAKDQSTPQYYQTQQQQPQYYQAGPDAVGASKGVSQQMAGQMPTTTVVYVSAGQMAAMTDVLRALVSVPGMWISSWFDVVEALTGFTRNKRYKLRVWDPARGAEVPKEGVTSGDVMKIKEDSDCCCRIFLGPARAFRMSLYPYAEGQYPPPGADIFTLPGSVTLERPFRCTFLCLQRPVMYVRHVTVGYIAEVRYPFCQPCSLDFNFYIHSPSRDADSGDMLPSVPLHVHASRQGEAPGTMWYRVRGRFCQAGFCCQLPFGPCKKVSFKIFDASDTECERPIGAVTKVWRDCCTAILDMDQFTIAFPPQANEVQRAAIIASTILIDFTLFEGRKGDGDSGGGGGGGGS